MKAYKCDICHEFRDDKYRYLLHIDRYNTNHTVLPYKDVCPVCMLKLGIDVEAAQEMVDKMFKKEETPNETR